MIKRHGIMKRRLTDPVQIARNLAITSTKNLAGLAHGLGRTMSRTLSRTASGTTRTPSMSLGSPRPRPWAESPAGRKTDAVPSKEKARGALRTQAALRRATRNKPIKFISEAETCLPGSASAGDAPFKSAEGRAEESLTALYADLVVEDLTEDSDASSKDATPSATTASGK